VFSLQPKVHPAMMINIKADAHYTIMYIKFLGASQKGDKQFEQADVAQR